MLLKNLGQGEPATSMFFISRGTVRVFVLSEVDDSRRGPPEETYIISLGAGSFFGEISLLDEVGKLDMRQAGRPRQECTYLPHSD